MQQETLSLAPRPSPFGSLNSANLLKINDKVVKKRACCHFLLGETTTDNTAATGSVSHQVRISTEGSGPGCGAFLAQ
jgi:hypothetical protein